jgi:hypothetical protein
MGGVSCFAQQCTRTHIASSGESGKWIIRELCDAHARIRREAQGILAKKDIFEVCNG